MWVFGYGSLVWKADFPYKQKVVGFIKGFKRRFYQHSVDHRGRPTQPGRVVTLLPSTENECVWGVAYEIHAKDIEFVTKHLDHREKNGYKKHVVTFFPHSLLYKEKEDEGSLLNLTLTAFPLTIYIGNEDNEWYAGPAEIEEIAQQVVCCEGPSGTNREYVYNLAEAMRTMAPNIEDDHLFALEAAVKKLDIK